MAPALGPGKIKKFEKNRGLEHAYYKSLIIKAL